LTNPSMGSLPGSLIQRETRSSYGSRLKANEMLGPRKAPGYNLAMPLSRLFLAMLMALFSIAVAAAQTDTSGAKLIEDFRKAKYSFNQFEIGKKIVAFNDRSLLDNLKDLLSSEDRHVRGNAAFLFASLGDSRGLGIIAEIIQDTSYRVEGQGQPIALATANIMSRDRFAQIAITPSICLAS
jgi:hypothetical protein